VWCIAQAAARGNKVVLTGDGGDEIFGGYLTYVATRLHQRITAAIPTVVRTGLAQLSRFVPTAEGKVTLSYKLWRFLRALDVPPGVAHFSWNGTWLPSEAGRLVTSPPARQAAAGAIEAVASGLGLTRSCSVRRLQLADIAEYLPNDILVKLDRMSMAHGLETRAPLLSHRLAEWALGLPDAVNVGPGRRSKPLLRALVRARYGDALAD